MLGWFKRRGAPQTGPDYRRITSQRKAEKLCKQGELQKLLLFPEAFGGEDVPPNVVYVPPFAAELKTRIDQDVILPLVQEGRVRHYEARPEYEGDSFVPVAIHLSAIEPGEFNHTLAIWGKALEQESREASRPLEPPTFTPPTDLPASATPEQVVHAFITDYEAWNRFANAVNSQDDNMAHAESAYRALIEKYCPPGHEPQPISFGSEPSHTHAHETILGSEHAGHTCVVKTRHAQPMGARFFNSDYEYHLRKAGERWFLTSLLYVDGNERYEGL